MPISSLIITAHPKMQCKNVFIRINGELIHKSVVEECNTSHFGVSWLTRQQMYQQLSNSVCVRYVWEKAKGADEVCGFALFL